jgi:biotin carboxyl carrier protein
VLAASRSSVAEIRVREGDSIVEGQVLAVLET